MMLLATLVNLKLSCIIFVEGEVQQQTLGRLGTTQCELVPARLVKWVSHWNTLHTTETPQTVQVGVPLEHTAHYRNPTNCSSRCPIGTHCTLPKPHKLFKSVSHWNTLHTTKTPQTVQVGVPLEHTAHYQNPTKHDSCSSLVVSCSVLSD